MRKVREPLSNHDLERLESAARSYDERLVVWVLLDTGLRVAEFCSLRRRSYNFQNHRLVIVGKRRKRREIPVSDRCAALLERHFAVDDHIGYSVRTVQRIVRRVADRARISRPVSPHVLRHTFGVQSVRKEISLPAIQKALGHESLRYTQIYLNLSADDVADEYRRKW